MGYTIRQQMAVRRGKQSDQVLPSGGYGMKASLDLNINMTDDLWILILNKYSKVRATTEYKVYNNIIATR